MTDVASALPSAGWYDDPSSDASMRWWDGRGWTDNSMPKPASIPEPSAPPMGIAYSVDEQRATDSPRRAARARALRSDDGLARIVQLHPNSVDADAEEQPAPYSHSAEPLPVVPPVTAPQDATRFADPAPDLTHLPQLGRVPDQVFAPEPVAVVVQPVLEPALEPSIDRMQVVPTHVDAALSDAVAAAWTSAVDDSAPLPVPAPGSLVGAPDAGSTIEFVLPGSHGATLPTPVPVRMVATTVGPRAAPSVGSTTVAPPMSAAPTVAPALPVGLPTSPDAFTDDPEPEPVVEQPVASAPRPSTDWWAGLIPSRSSTAPARLLALAPFVSLSAMAAVAYVVVKLPELLLGTLAIPMLAIALPLVLAALDRRALHELGWERQAGALWALLGPFWYLVARQVVLARQGARVAPLMIGAIVISTLAPIAMVAAAQVFAPQIITLASHIRMLSGL